MARALRVALIQSGRIVEDRTFTGRAKISVGSDPKCTFIVPLADVPTRTPVFELSKRGARLVFEAHREGQVSLEGTEASLQSLDGLTEKKGAWRSLPLTEKAKGRLSVGEVSLLFQFVEPPKTPAPAELPRGSRGMIAQVDRSFLVVLGLSLAAHFGGVGWISSQPVPVERDFTLEDLEADRFARVILPLPRPKTPQGETKVPGEALTDAPKTPAATPSRRPAVARAPSADTVRERIRHMGMIGVIGAKGDGPGAFGDILKDTGVTDIAQALQGARDGLAVASVDDATAGRRKGAEQGQVTGIETLGTEGVRQVGLDEKGPASVVGRVQTEKLEIDTPDIDERALSRWLNQRKPAVQSCYERELKRAPTLQGRMVIRFAVDVRGHVARVGFEDDTLHSPAVQQCITTVMRAWVLPFQPEDEVPVALPFIFTASS